MNRFSAVLARLAHLFWLFYSISGIGADPEWDYFQKSVWLMLGLVMAFLMLILALLFEAKADRQEQKS